MALSYSFHIGSKKHAITSLKKLESVSKHNLRKFQSKIFDGSKNELLIGSDDLVKDTKKFYNDFFKNALDEYNLKQKRSDRKIKNYFNHVCDDVQKHIAVECIIQVGGYDFWEDKNLDERKKMTPIFKKQIEKLQKELPNFKIINAVIHYDEACPHVQLVGVPIKENCKKGLAVQVSKTSNFNKESLEVLQVKMREDIENEMQEIYGKDIDLKAKEKGRNHDLLIKDYIKLKQEQEKQLKSELEPIQKQMQDNINQLSNQKDEIQKEIQEKEAIKNKYKEDKIWYSAKTINKIDTEKQVKRKGSIPFTEDYNKKIVVLDKENYEIMLTMAKDQSTQLTAWKQSSNGFESENKKLKDDLKSKDEKIEELETTISNQKDEIEELDTKISFIDYAIKMFLKEQTYNKIKEIAEEIKNYWDLKKVKQKIDNFAFPFTKNKNKYKDYDDFEK